MQDTVLVRPSASNRGPSQKGKTKAESQWQRCRLEVLESFSLLTTTIPEIIECPLLYVEPVCPQEYQELCFKTPRFLQVGTRECFKAPSNPPNGQKIEKTLVDVAVPQFAEDTADVQDCPG